MEKITIQDSHCTLIDGIQFYSTRAPQKQNSFESNFAQISEEEEKDMERIDHNKISISRRKT